MPGQKQHFLLSAALAGSLYVHEMLPCRFTKHAVQKGIGCGALLWQSSTPQELYACKLNWLRQQASHHMGRRAGPLVAFASAVHACELTSIGGLGCRS